MQVERDEPEIIERVAALDVGKAEVVCCVRLPGPNGRRMQEVRTVTTMTVVELTRFGGHPELGHQARGRGPGGPIEQVLTGVPGAGCGAGPGDRQDGR